MTTGTSPETHAKTGSIAETGEYRDSDDTYEGARTVVTSSPAPPGHPWSLLRRRVVVSSEGGSTPLDIVYEGAREEREAHTLRTNLELRRQSG